MGNVPSPELWAIYKLATALEIHVGLNYVPTESMRGEATGFEMMTGHSRIACQILDERSELFQKIRARCSVYVSWCVYTFASLHWPSRGWNN